MAIIRFFSRKVSLYKLREKGCDVEISHQIIILVCLCIGGYYITLIYIYIYIYIYCLSVGRGGFHPGGVSWMSTSLSSGGCCHEAVDGWPRPTIDSLTTNLRIYIFYIRYVLCFDYPPTYLVRLHNGDDTP